MTKILIGLVVFAVGMLQPVQAGINAEFRRHATHPFQAGALNMIIGAAAVVVAVLLSGIGLPRLESMRAAPWWSFGGGFIGATIVITMLTAAPRLGAALLIGCFVAGQLVSSLVIDGRGWVGYPRVPISLARVAGVALVFMGVVVLERASRGSGVHV